MIRDLPLLTENNESTTDFKDVYFYSFDDKCFESIPTWKLF